MPQLHPYKVYVETDRPDFPQVCICSGDEATCTHFPTPPSRAHGLPPPERPIRLPYSEACLSRLKFGIWRSTWRLVALSAALWAGGLPVAIGAGPVYYLPGFLLTAGILVWTERLSRRNCCPTPGCRRFGDAMRAIWWRKSTYIFSFASQSYAEQFKLANERYLTRESE